MKRIINIILSTILTITVSAQDRTPVEKIWEEVFNITGARQDSRMKINHGDGVVRYVQNGPLGKFFECSKDCGGDISPYWANMKPEEVEESNKRNGKIFDGIFNAVRHSLDSLMELSEEGFHHESHGHDTDTITYSLCLRNNKESVKKIKMNDGSMGFPDAVETVSFNFTANTKSCASGKHFKGYGILAYNKNVYLPDRKSYYFDKQPYLDMITSFLKRKKIKSWDFKWAQSEDYDIDSNRSREFKYGNRMGYGGPKNYGQTLGSIYFIPREKIELAEEIFTKIDSLTLNYTDIHPEQMFRYTYNVKENIMQYTDTERNDILEMFEGTTGKDFFSIRVHFGITPQGYYVVITDSEKNFCIPQKWYALKRFINGKKEYIPGYKKGETEPLLFPSIPK